MFSFILIISLLILRCLNEQKAEVIYSIKPVTEIELEFDTEFIQISEYLNVAIIASYSGDVAALDLNNMNKILKQTQKLCDKIQHVHISEDQKYAFLSCVKQGFKILKLDTISGYQLLNFQSNGYSWHLFFNNKHKIMFCSTDQGYQLYDINNIESPGLIKEVTGIGQSKQISVSPDLKFFFQAQEVEGFILRDISEKHNGAIVAQNKFEIDYGISKLLLHPTKKFVFLQSKWGNLYIVDYQKYYNLPYPSPCTVDATLNDILATEKKDLAISHDGKFIYMVCNSVGVYVVDIQDIYNPLLFQVLQKNTMLGNMGVQRNSKEYIYIAVVSGVIVFKASTPFYQQKNMFTYYQSEKWTGKTKDFYPWTTKLTRNETLMWMAIQADGLRCFDITNLPHLELLIEYNSTSLPGYTSPVSVVSHLNDDDILITSNWKQRGFFILNVTDIKKPIIVSFLDFEVGRVGHNLQNFPKSANRILISTQFEVRVIDISNIEKPRQIAMSQFPGQQYEDIKECTMSKNERFIYAPANKVGQFLTMELSQDHKTISLVNSTSYSMPQKIIVSQRYDNILYAASNLAGIRIYNTTEGVPRLISQLKVSGFVWEIQYPPDENSLFLAAQQKNEVMVIDIHDLDNPRMINIFQVRHEYGLRLTFIQQLGKREYLIINTSTGIRALPIEADVRLNMDVFKQDPKSLKYQKVNPDTQHIYPIFQVGEKGKTEFQILENPQQNEIHIKAVKEYTGFNSVVVRVFVKMQFEELIVPNKINEELAQKLFQKAQEFNYITQDGFPTDHFNIQEPIILMNEGNLQQYANDLKQVLKNKIQFVPFSFIIKESLFFNYNYSDISQGLIIETLSDQIEMTFQVDLQKAEFFKQNFQGVLSSYSEKYSEILLQGKKLSMNNILNQVKIEIYNKTDIKDLQVKIMIDDGLNYRLELEKPITEIKFLRINESVKQGQSVQKQFDNIYKDGQVWLEEEFSFTFSKESFKDDDDLKYQLYAYVIEKKKYVQIQQYESFQYYSINFYASERLIRGIPLRSMFMQKIKLKIEASDGYSSQSQYVYIKANRIPFVILGYYMFLFGSGIISIFGIIKYRGKIHMVFCKSRYNIGEVYIRKGEDFMIQILLSRSDTIVVSQYKDCILKYLKKYKRSVSSLFMECIGKEQYRNQIFDFKKIKNILELSNTFKDAINTVKFANQDSIQFIILQSFLFQELFNKDKVCRKHLETFKKYSLKRSELNSHRWYEFFVHIKSQEVSEKVYKAPKIYFKVKVLYKAILEMYHSYMSEKDLNRSKLFLSQILTEYDAIDISDLQLREWVGELQLLVPPSLNLFLLLEIIKVQALGFIQLKAFNHTQGQCIQKQMQDITLAKALIKRKTWFKWIYTLLNMEYVEIPLAQNTPLPYWMDYHCENNVIEIFGKCPDNKQSHSTLNKKQKRRIMKEEENIAHNAINLMIRIEDCYKIICRQFILIKLEKDDNKEIFSLRLKGVNDQNQVRVRLNKSQFFRSPDYFSQNKESKVENLQSKQDFLLTVSEDRPILQQQQIQILQENIREPFQSFTNSQLNDLMMKEDTCHTQIMDQSEIQLNRDHYQEKKKKSDAYEDLVDIQDITITKYNC